MAYRHASHALCLTILIVAITLLQAFGVNAQTAESPHLTIDKRVKPLHATTITAVVSISGIPAGKQVNVLQFIGDDKFWSNADLLFVQKSGTSYTFSRVVTASEQVGLHNNLAWRARTDPDSALFGPIFNASIEVTCSDGVFCNGEERFIRGQCINAVRAACDDEVSCTLDTCNETLGTCHHAPQGAACKSCDSKKCTPKCHRRACGDDGCGGSCGQCTGGQFCVEGVCQSISLAGTCANPLPLFGQNGLVVPDGGVPDPLVVVGDTTKGLNIVVPTCNTASTAKELIYAFQVTSSMGIDARVTGYDTVLEIRKSTCLDPSTVVLNGCSDDDTPPGNLGSRVASLLSAGTYYLIVDGYSSSNVGPFTLTVKFVPDCVPNCDGKACGDDSCGGTCGLCGVDQACGSSFTCGPLNCVPDCNGRQCGSDGCGGSCGNCTKSDQYCIDSTGKCKVFESCNNFLPVCNRGRGCGPKSYCGSDCKCYKLGENIPDLVIGPNRIIPELVFEFATFSNTSCAISENCVEGPGTRRLMRFPTEVVNQGLGALKPPQQSTRPDLFEWAPCHGHFHFKGFANYELRSLNGTTVLKGRKQSYCMEDSYQYLLGPNIPCTPLSTCENQGLQAGWADLYGNVLDCQWLDITDHIPSGQYTLYQETNVYRTFHEETFENNAYSVIVTIP